VATIDHTGVKLMTRTLTAEQIAAALGGRKSGGCFIARCPAHDDHNPSLTISDGHDGKVLVKCFSGCSQEKVISALRSLDLWPDNQAFHRDCIPAFRHSTCKPAIAKPENIAGPKRIFDEAVQASGTFVETYFRSREIHIEIPPSIRFHRALPHRTGGFWPCMVAQVTSGLDGQPMGIHRTFLTAGGRAKAPVEPNKMMLGQCRGGAVRLAAATELLMVGEGIETCLSAMVATGLPAWAALSTSGLKTLILPPSIMDVIILADGDDAGENAAQESAKKWLLEGRRVRIARPPRGFDFNDVLMAGTLAKGA